MSIERTSFLHRILNQLGANPSGCIIGGFVVVIMGGIGTLLTAIEWFQSPQWLTLPWIAMFACIVIFGANLLTWGIDTPVLFDPKPAEDQAPNLIKVHLPVPAGTLGPFEIEALWDLFDSTQLTPVGGVVIGTILMILGMPLLLLVVLSDFNKEHQIESIIMLSLVLLFAYNLRSWAKYSADNFKYVETEPHENISWLTGKLIEVGFLVLAQIAMAIGSRVLDALRVVAAQLRLIALAICGVCFG